MTLNLTIPQQNHSDFTPRITVIGVGGGGTNAVDNMIQSQLQGVEFIVANTDAQQLSHSKADRRIQLGPHLTQGLGAGAKPEIGRAAAEEACDELSRHLDGAHMVFITAGMGGGTGTGAAPVIARMARERGILTVGVVTKPFMFEGMRRTKSAEAGIAELQQFVDTLIVIPNQNLFRMANESTSWRDAFKMADNVLYMGVRGVTDLMMAPGLVNLDFADIRTIMAEMGKAMMGTGDAEGDNRAIAAAEAAISNPLLEDTSMKGAQGLLINITGGEDLTLFEVDQAANRIREEVAEDANIIFGSAIDTSLNGKIRVSVVATGIDNPPGRVAPQPAEAAEPASPAQPAPEATTAPVPPTTAQATAPQAPPAPPLQHPAAPRPGQPPAPGAGQRPIGAAPRAPSPHAVPPQAQRGSPRSPLFTENARPQAPEPQAAPRSLFGIVTGALRRHSTPPQPEAPQPQRTEPSVQQQQPAQPPAPPAPGGTTQPDDGGLDIPAFLRRRSH
ncbi:cell division protein FtsZ [Komagataeibacter sp. AV436]|uniref:Cell division protein FtsZ n=1 Tax=Komagataeibacter melomenusus TaxID=2766578 RepID=A0ABX2AG01_9PROT|nr:cell division protein FtsZ [Komagataeibacter melomenusus]MBV1831550.1 cell division protein FtsZ [Komagataeibacter melomenusus]NPC67304.1 cell division protein FtsZ [Komagataeibacter melomenusus]